jgi:hypothetical protein
MEPRREEFSSLRCPGHTYDSTFQDQIEKKLRGGCTKRKHDSDVFANIGKGQASLQAR